jgi:four helix bundle protein
MPPPPPYHALDAYNLSKKLVVACYELTHSLPQEEKTNLTQYIRTAGLTVHLAVAQGAFLKKKKKKEKYMNRAQNALLVINAAIEVLLEVKLVNEGQTTELMELSSSCYQLLDRLKKQN